MMDNEIGKKLIDYCDKYFIPQENIFHILEDQKVLPMIRGKGMEYSVYYLLTKLLDPNEWVVQKLNLSAQTNNDDQDITITHRRTGISISVESKSAVRGSFSLGKRAKIIKEPHFKVKCHRSRSNVKLAKTSNDRYHVSTFDVIVSNTVNSIYTGNTIGDSFETPDGDELKALLDYYKLDDASELEQAAFKDWRFALPHTIALDEYIPRTPYVRLNDDENWRPIKELNACILDIVKVKRKR